MSANSRTIAMEPLIAALERFPSIVTPLLTSRDPWERTWRAEGGGWSLVEIAWAAARPYDGDYAGQWPRRAPRAGD